MFARNREKIAREPATTPPPHRATWVQTAAQRVVARRMQESKQTIPHFYLQTSANAEAAARRREAAPGEKPAWDAFFVFALGKALMQYPRLSASYVDGELQPQNADAVGVAVDQGGDLFICPITHPAAKTPEQIGVELAEWLRHLQNGDPLARKIQPANLTVTNLGGTGVEAFAAVINPPEAAILAVGKVAPAAVVADGQVTVQRRVMLTLSVDHRVVNGRYAAEFLAEVVRQFESL
jgi:pyruvate dehydrogenase E2 component (dihydrolipoamide acetyltransferase)